MCGRRCMQVCIYWNVYPHNLKQCRCIHFPVALCWSSLSCLFVSVCYCLLTVFYNVWNCFVCFQQYVQCFICPLHTVCTIVSSVFYSLYNRFVFWNLKCVLLSFTITVFAIAHFICLQWVHLYCLPSTMCTVCFLSSRMCLGLYNASTVCFIHLLNCVV